MHNIFLQLLLQRIGGEMEEKEDENKEKEQKIEKIKKVKELMELSKNQDKEISDLNGR